MTFRSFLILAFCTIAFSAFAAGAANEIEIPVPARDLARGTIIAEGDLALKAVPAARANAAVLRDPSEAAGKETRRLLRAGEPIRASDLKRPALVAKGSTVTMVFEAPGLTLTAVGRALAEGGDGDTIAVLNPTSYRQVVARVAGPGVVRVGPAAIAGADPARR